MFCKNCGKPIESNSKFCGKCGKNIFDSILFESSKVNSSRITVTNQTLCEVCGKPAEVKYIELYENKGALVMRYHREIKGKLCKNCINEYFWKFTLTTLFIGWFGTISFIVTPFYLINNISRYVWIKIK